VLLALVACVRPVVAEPAEGPRTDLAVYIQGFRSDAGAAYVALFRSEDGYPGDQSKALMGRKVTISKKNRVKVVFRDLPAGTYAVAVLHDEDGDGALDTNVLGIPTEGTGASNDVRSLGPPSFEDAAFQHPAPNARILINIRYF
jgi:uncharacterized protein (DUF2141 family)